MSLDAKSLINKALSAISRNRHFSLVNIVAALIVSIAILGSKFLALEIDNRFNKSLTFDTRYTFQPSLTRSVTGRIFLFHGLRSDVAYWSEQPYTSLTWALRRQGYELVAINLPYAKRASFDDGGVRYCAAYTKALRDIVETVSRDHGARSNSIALGLSWGGLHALVAGTRTDLFNSVIASFPVTTIASLKEFRGLSNAGCSGEVEDASSITALKRAKTLLIYGDRDTRVDYRQTIALADRWKAHGVNFDLVNMHGLGHQSTEGEWDIIMDWLADGKIIAKSNVSVEVVETE